MLRHCEHQLVRGLLWKRRENSRVAPQAALHAKPLACAIRRGEAHISLPKLRQAAALEADGYKKENWGIDIVSNDDEYYKYLFLDYDYVTAPIYFWPFTPNVMSTGGFTNGYGFS